MEAPPGGLKVPARCLDVMSALCGFPVSCNIT
jgi:hypothetical protein